MRYGSYKHKDVKHTSVALTESRSDAIARIASRLGISQHTLLQRFITLGICLNDEDC